MTRQGEKQLALATKQRAVVKVLIDPEKRCTMGTSSDLQERTKGERLVSQRASNAGLRVDAVASLDSFVRAHGARIAAIARRLAVAREDVVAQTHLAWLEAQNNFDAAHHSGARLSTYVFRAVEQALSHATLAPSNWVSIHGSDIAADAGDRGFVAIDDLRLYDVADPNDSALAHRLSRQLDDHLTQLYADLVFNDAIRAHPVYAHSGYRQIIDGLLAQETKHEIARKMGRSVRRVEQMITEVIRIIQRGDPILDQALIELEGDQTRQSDPVRYRSLDSLHFEEKGLNAAELVQSAVSILKHGLVRPVVCDQFLRVLLGDLECCAARHIGLKFVKTIVYPLAAGAQAQDPDVFARTKRSLSGAHTSEGYSADLYLTLARKLANGTLSTLVATRLAFLPHKVQRRVTTRLGALVALLTTADAHALVKAHDARDFERALDKLYAELGQRMGDALGPADTDEA